MKKIIIPGLLAGLVMLVLNMAISYFFMRYPSVSADYLNPSIMRPFSDSLTTLFFLSYFVQGIILAWVWERTKSLLPGTAWARAYQFGFAIWIIATVPGMLLTYGSFPLAPLTIISWTIAGLVGAVAAGYVYVKLNA